MSTVGKPITCRAAVIWKPGQPYVIENVEVDVPKKREVRVRMKSAGCCHSDLHIQEGIDPAYIYPSVLGHEGAGIIESVGEGVTTVRPGDTVVMCFEAHCGECDYCKDSRTNQCLKQPRNNFQMDGTSRITCKGQKLSQMGTVSVFSEYSTTSEFNCTKVNPKANPNTLCLAGCCIPTGYGAVMNCGPASLVKGATCAVWGLGGVGMCSVMGCRDSGASKIIGIDTNPKKFPIGKEFGCTDFLNPKDVDDVPKALAEMTKGGVDFCFVSVGIIPVMEQAFKSSHHAWGKTVVIGLADIGASMKAEIWELLYGRALVGTYYGSYKAKLSIPGLVDKVVSGQIQLEKLITHKLPLSKINEAFELLATGQSLRAIIDFDLKD